MIFSGAIVKRFARTAAKCSERMGARTPRILGPRPPGGPTAKVRKGMPWQREPFEACRFELFGACLGSHMWYLLEARFLRGCEWFWTTFSNCFKSGPLAQLRDPPWHDAPTVQIVLATIGWNHTAPMKRSMGTSVLTREKKQSIAGISAWPSPKQ